MNQQPSQAAFVLDYFKSRPNEALEYDDWTDEQEARYWALTGYRPRFFRTVARRLAGEGKLRKVRNGVYMFDPDLPQVVLRRRRRAKTVQSPPPATETVADDQTDESTEPLVAAAMVWLAELEENSKEAGEWKRGAFYGDLRDLFSKYARR